MNEFLKRHDNIWIKQFIFWLPVIFTIVWVVFCAVNLPLHDEWDVYVPMIIKYSQGNLGFGDFWAAVNEHRMFLPKLLTMATAIPSGYDTRFPMFLTQLFMIIGFVILIMQIRRQHFEAFKKYPLWLLLVPTLFYTWRQYDNYLYGIQIAFIMTTTFVIAMSFLLSESIREENTGVRFWIFQIISILLAVCASLCMSNGLFAWFVAFVQIIIAMVFQRKYLYRHSIVFIIWAIAAGLMWYIYFGGTIPHSTSTISIKRIFVSLLYFLGFLGSPLIPDRIFAILTGALFLGIFAYAVVRLFKEKSVLKNNSWIGLSVFGLLSGLAIAWGRAEQFGIWQSRASRYVAFSILFVISVFMIIHSLENTSLNKRIRNVAIVFVIIGLIWGSLIQGIPKGFSSHSQKAKLVTWLKKYESHSDIELQEMYWPDGTSVRGKANMLRQYKLSVFNGN